MSSSCCGRERETCRKLSRNDWHLKPNRLISGGGLTITVNCSSFYAKNKNWKQKKTSSWNRWCVKFSLFFRGGSRAFLGIAWHWLVVWIIQSSTHVRLEERNSSIGQSLLHNSLNCHWLCSTSRSDRCLRWIWWGIVELWGIAHLRTHCSFLRSFLFFFSFVNF